MSAFGGDRKERNAMLRKSSFMYVDETAPEPWNVYTLPFLPSYSCDFGYEGARCEQPTSPAPMTLQETFEDPLVISTSSTVDIAGGLVGYLCGVLASGKAVVFNQAGKRSLTTTELNTTAAR